VPKPPSMSQFKHVVVFVLLADALDLIWRVLCLAGIEHDPSPGPWSHGLFMSVVWSAIAVLVAWRVSDSVRTGVLVGLVVYSHWDRFVPASVVAGSRYRFEMLGGKPQLVQERGEQ